MSDSASFHVEESQPKNRNLFLWGIVIFATLSILVGILINVFNYTWNQHLLNQTQPDISLLKQREQDNQRLQTVGWVDQDKKETHIPIEQAMRLLIERANQSTPEKK